MSAAAAAATSATTVPLTDASFSMMPMAHVTTASSSMHWAAGVAEANVICGSRISVTAVVVDAAGPLFAIVHE